MAQLRVIGYVLIVVALPGLILAGLYVEAFLAFLGGVLCLSAK